MQISEERAFRQEKQKVQKSQGLSGLGGFKEQQVYPFDSSIWSEKGSRLQVQKSKAEWD